MNRAQTYHGCFRLLAATLLVMAACPTLVQAQFGRRQNTGQEALNPEQFLLAPRTLTRLLRDGETAIEEKRYSDGIEALGTLLLEEPRDDLPEDALHQDYFNEPAQEGYYRSSVRGKALKLLGSIPDEGRKILEIQYGVSARQALALAVAARDMEAISEVTRKYYHTEAGYDASILLAQDKLIRGYPIAAAGILDRLSAFPAARKRFGAQLIGDAAGAWMQAGRLDLAMRALTDGSQYFPGASILLAGRPSTLDGKQDWAKLLGQLYPKQDSAGSRNLENWLMTGGQPDRNGTVSAGLPMPIVAWHMTLHRDRGDEETVNQMASSRQSQSGSPLVPKLEARMIGDIVLAKTASANVFAVDLETGLRKWPFYKDGIPLPLTSRLQGSPDAEEVSMGNSLRTRVWGSSAFGQFTIDANQLYYITSTEEQRAPQPTMNFQRMSSPPAHNMLIGVSLQGEGKEMWQVGGPESPSEPELANAYFLGPPLSFEGDLYALVEINLETRLVVLDSRTGKQQWAQQLALSALTPIRNDLLRQSQALSPSISDAVVVCPIGNGAIIAVDLLTRSLMWGKQYTSNNAPPSFNQGFSFDATDSYDPFEDRWLEPQVMIHNGRIVFTPPETNQIMCLDLLTGEKRWDQLRGGARYVAGIYKDRAVVVSNTGVYALNLTDGMPSWGSEVLLNGRSFNSKDREKEPSAARGRESLAGKGVRDGQFLYLPTTGQRVLKVDLEAGKMVDSAKVDQPLGNLFAYKNRLISVGATRITAYYTRESLTTEVDQRLTANAKDNWALNQKSLLLTAEGKVAEAIDLLRKSYQIDPDNGETRYLLVDALLAGLESDFDRYLPLATEFEPIIDSQRFRFLVMLARGNLKAGQYELAFSRLMELVRERSTSRQPGLQARVQTMTLSSGHQVDIDTWIAVHLGMVFEKASPELRQKMLDLIEDRMKAAASSHPLTREAELRFLTWLEPAHASILKMATQLLKGADQTRAERMLQPLLYKGNDAVRQQVAELLKQNAQADDRAAGNYRGGRSGLRGLGDPLAPAEPVELPDTVEPAAATATPWPSGMIDSQVIANSGAVFNQVRVRHVSNRYGRGPVELNLTNDHLIISNAMGNPIGSCLFQEGAQAFGDGMLRAQVDGGLVFVETTRELIAFDMYRADEMGMEPVLWRHSLSRIPTNPRKQHAPPLPMPVTNVLGMRSHSRGADREAIIGPVTPAGIVIQKESEVVLLDPLTGSPLWSRGGYDATTTLVAQGLEVAVVSVEKAKIDVLDCRDGSLLRQVDQVVGWKPLCGAGKHLVQIKEKSSGKLKSPIPTDTPDSCDVRILDAFSGKVVVETSFAPSTKAECCSDRFLVAIEESGRLWYCNIETGQVVEQMIDKQPKLQHVRVQQFGDRLVAWTSLQSPMNRDGLTIKPDTDDPAMSRGLFAINGSIIALDANTGQMLWDRAGMLSRFVFNSAQPRNSPFIAFYRVVTIGGSRTVHAAVIDLRDGTLAYANNSLPTNPQSLEGSEFAMKVDPIEHVLFLSVGTTEVVLKSSNVEKPPQPVCYYGVIGGKKQTGAPFNLSR